MEKRQMYFADVEKANEEFIKKREELEEEITRLN